MGTEPSRPAEVDDNDSNEDTTIEWSRPQARARARAGGQADTQGPDLDARAEKQPQRSAAAAAPEISCVGEH